VGRAAAALPWLCPNTDSLIRLAEAPAGLTRPFAADPALLLFLLRFSPSASPLQSALFSEAGLASSSLPEAAVAYLTHSTEGWLHPTSEVVRRCRALTAHAAPLARRLAEITHRACPERAFAAAMLAPLGWLAVAAVNPGIAAEALHDPETPPGPSVQAAVWNLDQNAIARRLAYRWRLPDWIATILGNLGMPLLAARPVVADADLFAVVQLAVSEAERRTRSLGLADSAERADLLTSLKVDDAILDEQWCAVALPATAPAPTLDQNPHKVPLVTNLLKIAAESRRRNGAALVARLEDRLDHLHTAVSHIGDDVELRGRDAKLAALAELAAGAGHEINNPLAIISGNAQRLFRTEPDTERGAALQTIIRQSQRIAGIVRDLMHFARPPRANPHRTPAADLLAGIRDELTAFAAERRVKLEFGNIPAGVFVRCDLGQVKHALAAVVRNGIEAAGEDGTVRVSCSDSDEEMVAFVIEDSGPGLSAAVQQHCFDPFYCGRSAGRGRGLGLSTAWQFARQNGGDVRHEPTAEGVTRFVVTVPRSITLEFIDRQSA
jgi:signal transduction histidine kinase